MVRWDQYSGYLSSPKTVTVSARVSGLIEQAPFQEGAIVHAGDLLFKIDPRPFQADLDNKKAAVAQARATAIKAKADFGRSVELIKAQVIAPSDFDTTKASYGEAAASLDAAEAALETSRLNLEWTEVRAPITGRVSRMNVTVGNLVNGGSGTGHGADYDRLDRSALWLHQRSRKRGAALPGAGAEGEEGQRRGSEHCLFSATGKRDEFSASGRDRFR